MSGPFAFKVMQKAPLTFSGLGSYQLDPTGVGAWQLWPEEIADGERAFYYAENEDGTLWERGFGTFDAGAAPNTLSRDEFMSSSTGSPIDWQSSDGPIYIYSVPDSAALNHLLSPLVDGEDNLPAWLPDGARWIDSETASIWRLMRRIAADDHVEEGRFHLDLAGPVSSIFAPSARRKFEDIGAANHVLTADDLGKVLCFDTTAGARTLTMLASDADGMGHGACIFVYPYGSDANGVTFTPGGSDTTELATAPPKRLTTFRWDGARSKWIADYTAPAATIYPAGTIDGLSYANGSDTANDIDVAAGGAMDSTGARWMALAAVLTKQLDASWAAGTAAGGRLSGSLADGDHNIWLICRTDTGAVDVGFETTASATPTLPANYTLYRKIGWFQRASGSIVAFKTWETAGGGLAFRWTSPTRDVNQVNTLTTARRTDALKVPLDFEVDARVRVLMTDASAAFYAVVCSPGEADVAPSVTDTPGANIIRNSGGTDAGGDFEIRTDNTGKIAARASLATVDLYAVMTLGFDWARR